MGDYQLQVGQRFELPTHQGMIATIQEKLTEERWRVAWSRGGGEATCTSNAIQGWITAGSWVPIQAYETPRLESAGQIPAAELARMRDESELSWWRTQFATRFPAGQLPKPGTPLVGKRYHLSEGEFEPGTSFHLGVDLADGPSKTIISVVKDGTVVAYARLDIVEEVKKLDAYLTDFYPNAARVLEREAHRLVRTLRTGPVPPIAPTAKVPAAWTPEWDPFDFLKP